MAYAFLSRIQKFMMSMQNDRKTEAQLIAFFLPDLSMGGAERVFLTLASSMAQRGFKVELILARRNGTLLADVPPEVKITCLTSAHRKGPLWIFGIHTLFQLTAHLRKSQPDILFSTLTGANITAILARALSRRNFQLCIREASSLRNVNSKFRILLMQLLYPLADNIIALTQYAASELSKKIRNIENKIVHIGNPINIEKIQTLAETTELTEIAKKLTPYVVCVGRLAEPKDFSTAIRAVHLINTSDEKTQLKLVIVGDGPLKQELHDLTEKLAAKDYIFFAGQQSNPYPWIAQSSVFLLSTRWEGYPNVLFEAQSLGVPIVATIYDASLYEITRDIERIWYSQVTDVESVASGIKAAREAPRVAPPKERRELFEDILSSYIKLIPTKPTEKGQHTK